MFEKHLWKSDILSKDAGQRLDLLVKNCFKDALLGLKQFVATENPLQMMEIAFNFTLRAPFVLEIFKVLF